MLTSTNMHQYTASASCSKPARARNLGITPVLCGAGQRTRRLRPEFDKGAVVCPVFIRLSGTWSCHLSVAGCFGRQPPVSGFLDVWYPVWY